MKKKEQHSNNWGLKIKIIIAILGIILVTIMLMSATDDNTYVCTKGKIHFFSSAAMENIEANSTSAICVINTDTKKVSAKIQETSFVFASKLMREHFNENYMESDKYPYGVLDMIITNDIDFTKDGTYDITLKGTLDIHGVKKEREIPGKLIIKNGQPVNATATFIVKMIDHQIKIPHILGAKIAEEMKVDVDFSFEKYKK